MSKIACCSFCDALISNFGLSTHDFVDLTDDKFAKFFGQHPHLIEYADFGNGVSEAGFGMMCTACKTFVDVHFVIEI